MPEGILISGAGSRLARATRRHFAARGITVTGLVRGQEPALAGEELLRVMDYFAPPITQLQTGCVVNFAGIGGEDTREALTAINVEGPLRLARAAREAGTRHFVSISSSHVYGRAQLIGAETPENPTSLYGESKKVADAALLTLQTPDFGVAILRIPMVYGPGLGKNLRDLARLMDRIGFLPSPASPVRRSLLHADNFAHALAHVIQTRSTGVIRLADPEPLSFALLAELVAQKRGRPVSLSRWSGALLRPLLALRAPLYDRLYADRIFQQKDCLIPSSPYPVALREGLQDFLST